MKFNHLWNTIIYGIQSFMKIQLFMEYNHLWNTIIHGIRSFMKYNHL
jgi:hypothetical protein